MTVSTMERSLSACGVPVFGPGEVQIVVHLIPDGGKGQHVHFDRVGLAAFCYGMKDQPLPAGAIVESIHVQNGLALGRVDEAGSTGFFHFTEAPRFEDALVWAAVTIFPGALRDQEWLEQTVVACGKLTNASLENWERVFIAHVHPQHSILGRKPTPRISQVCAMLREVWEKTKT